MQHLFISFQECAKWIREYGKYPDPWYKLKFKPKEPKPEKKPKEKKEKKEKVKKEPKVKVSLDKLCAGGTVATTGSYFCFKCVSLFFTAEKFYPFAVFKKHNLSPAPPIKHFCFTLKQNKAKSFGYMLIPEPCFSADMFTLSKVSTTFYPQ